MAPFTAELDLVRRVALTPVIARAFWSRRTAWPGDVLKLHVETRWVPDGTPLTLGLVEQDSDEGGEDDVLGAIAGDHRIVGGKLVLDYTLDLGPEALGAELELEGDSFEFCFDVTIATYGLRARSTLLYVPIEQFHPSR